MQFASEKYLILYNIDIASRACERVCGEDRKAHVKGKWLILTFVFLSPVLIIYVHGHICEVGREKDETNIWMWVLPYPDPCLCTEVIMGGMNTWTPIRPFKPVYASTPLISDDMQKIRKHYNLKCDKEGKKL